VLVTSANLMPRGGMVDVVDWIISGDLRKTRQDRKATSHMSQHSSAKQQESGKFHDYDHVQSERTKLRLTSDMHWMDVSN
jgi:hypothetical protein